MAKPNAIRIGDTFRREYRQYNPKPLEEWANPDIPEPDLTSPKDLTGLTISWNLKNINVLHTFTTANGLTITPLLGSVLVLLTPAQTAVFKTDLKADSYLEVVDGTEEYSDHELRETILRKGEPEPK